MNVVIDGWRRLRLFLEMIRFSHTLFALPFALLSALLAWRLGPGTQSGWQAWLGIVLAMVFARSTAMAFNRLVDRRFDAQNPRTSARHLPAGLLSVRAVAGFACTCAVGFMASTLLFLPNRWPLLLSVPVLVVVCGYSYAKRFTALVHFWLGAALGLAPVAAWIAVRGEIAAAPLVLAGAVLLWVAGFDIIYACQDVDADRQLGLQSLPRAVGIVAALRIAAVCHLGMFILLLLLPRVYPALGSVYLAGVAAVGALLVYEHAIVRPSDLSRVNRAFFQVNAVVSVGLLAIVAVDLLV